MEAQPPSGLTDDDVRPPRTRPRFLHGRRANKHSRLEDEEEHEEADEEHDENEEKVDGIPEPEKNGDDVPQLQDNTSR